jgi:hypothetical protein
MIKVQVCGRQHQFRHVVPIPLLFFQKKKKSPYKNAIKDIHVGTKVTSNNTANILQKYFQLMIFTILSKHLCYK